MTAPPAALALGSARTAVGVGTWLAPRRSLRTFGLGPATAGPAAATGSVDVVSRLFGVRDLALGVAVLQPDPALRRAALRIGLAVDAVDAVASVLGARAGAPRRSLVGVAAGALGFVVLGALAERAEQAG